VAEVLDELHRGCVITVGLMIASAMMLSCRSGE
jgi:hypothetical protein